MEFIKLSLGDWNARQARPKVTPLDRCCQPSGAAASRIELARSGIDPALGALRHMDQQSKREILWLTIGTLMIEVPVVAIAALAIAAH
jgi:hypothetical protein